MALKTLASLVVPPVCACCGEPELSGEPLCAKCLARLPLFMGSRCLCGAPAPVPVASCPNCSGTGRRNYEGAWACAAYSGKGRELVAALKTHGSWQVAGLMAKIAVSRSPPGLFDGVLVPVPASATRHFKHGFDQAWLLTRALADRTGLACARLLRRTGLAPRQVGLERLGRLRNTVRFSYTGKGEPPSKVLLVDDVITTGATVNACATELRQAGVGQVNCIAFARTLRQ